MRKVAFSLARRATTGGLVGCAVGMLAFLQSCASTPRPAPSPSPAAFVIVPGSAARTASAPLPRNGGGGANPARGLAPARTEAPSLPSPPPRPAAVAAQFPEPNVAFATPAFQPGRQAFTNGDEMRSIFFGLERTATVGEASTSIKVLDIGASQLGAPLQALAFRRAPAAADPASSVPPPAHRPTVVLVAGQHGDEPAGSEALIVIAQELAAGRLDAVLSRVDVVLLPAANPDGAARFQRDAADGSDINRDHVLLRTPEAQAQARLIADLEPIVIADLHEYPVLGAFVAKFDALPRADVLLQYATVANLPPFITKAAEEWFRVPLLASLRSAGLNADWYYTTAPDPADRKLSMGGVGAQIGRNANGLKNAVSLLVESRGGGLGRVDFKRRVQAQVVAARSVLASTATHAADLVKLRQFVERDTVALACHGDAVVEAAPTASEYALAVLDPDSGAVRRITVAWDSALALRTVHSRPRPCGYWLADSEADAVARLRLLGIEVQQLDEAGELRGETYRETGREPIGSEAAGDAASAAGALAHVRVRTTPALLDLPVGSYYVSLAQPLANLVIAALEPESPASYAANGLIAKVDAEARILLRPAARMTRVP